jgi:hypothetical protein
MVKMSDLLKHVEESNQAYQSFFRQLYFETSDENEANNRLVEAKKSEPEPGKVSPKIETFLDQVKKERAKEFPEIKKLENLSTEIFTVEKVLIAFGYAVGIFLLAFAFYIFITLLPTAGSSINITGLSEGIVTSVIGSADILTLVLFKPVDEIAQAESSYICQMLGFSVYNQNHGLRMVTLKAATAHKELVEQLVGDLMKLRVDPTELASQGQGTTQDYGTLITAVKTQIEALLEIDKARSDVYTALADGFQADLAAVAAAMKGSDTSSGSQSSGKKSTSNQDSKTNSKGS